MPQSVQNKDVPPNHYRVNEWRESALTQLHRLLAASDLPPGPVNKEKMISLVFTLASFPVLPIVQFLIVCGMQKRRGRPGPFYHVNDISSTSVDRGGEGSLIEKTTFLSQVLELECLQNKKCTAPGSKRRTCARIFFLCICMLQAIKNWTVERPELVLPHFDHHDSEKNYSNKLWPLFSNLLPTLVFIT